MVYVGWHDRFRKFARVHSEALPVHRSSRQHYFDLGGAEHKFTYASHGHDYEFLRLRAEDYDPKLTVGRAGVMQLLLRDDIDGYIHI